MTESATPRTILVLGRQGSGKGVQCEALASAFDLEHVSTGAALRAAVRRSTTLGVQVERSLARGELVADHVVAALVASRLVAAGDRGIVLDGFPRTVRQAELLVDLLGSRRIDVAVNLDLPRSVAVTRLLARRVCPACGHSGREATCERCGRPTEKRTDDSPDVIGRRMTTDALESRPLLEWLDARGVLVTVDALGTPDEVTSRVRAAVANLPLAAVST